MHRVTARAALLPSSFGVLTSGALVSGAVAIGALATGCETDGPQQPATPVRDGDLSFADGRLGFRGHGIDFPATQAQLAELFGPPSRTVDKGGGMVIWDDLGITARPTPQNLVRDLELSLTSAHRDFSPKTAFAGRVALPTGAIDARSPDEALRAAGMLPERGGSEIMAWRAQLGRCEVLLTRFSGDTLSLVWLGPAPPPPPPLAEDELFEADARKYGFPFDETIREVSHRGNVSLIKNHFEGHDGVLGRSMFVGGALGELAQRRGYEYFVILDDLPAFLREPSPDGAPAYDMKIGFTHIADPDCAREFPQDHCAGPCEAQRSDFITDGFGGAWWPFGGVQPATPAEDAAAH